MDKLTITRCKNLKCSAKALHDKHSLTVLNTYWYELICRLCDELIDCIRKNHEGGRDELCRDKEEG